MVEAEDCHCLVLQHLGYCVAEAVVAEEDCYLLGLRYSGCSVVAVVVVGYLFLALQPLGHFVAEGVAEAEDFPHFGFDFDQHDGGDGAPCPPAHWVEEGFVPFDLPANWPLVGHFRSQSFEPSNLPPEA